MNTRDNTPRVIFNKTYDGFESIADLERDILDMWEDTPDIPSEFKGSILVRMVYAPYVSPVEKLLDLVEFNANPVEKEVLTSFLKTLEE